MLIRWPAGSGWPQPGLGSADRGVRRPRGRTRSPVVAGSSLRSRGRAAPGQQPRKPAERCSPPPARRRAQLGLYCWDKSALRFAFIFSRRFTKWPLLTSSSSVLSSAERSSLWSFLFSAFSSSSIFSAFSAADL